MENFAVKLARDTTEGRSMVNIPHCYRRKIAGYGGRARAGQSHSSASAMVGPMAPLTNFQKAELAFPQKVKHILYHYFNA